MPESDQLIARVREAVSLINRGDFDSAAMLVHPEVLIVRPGGLPSTAGKEAFRAWMEPDAFESQTFEMLEVEQAGQKVLAHVRSAARGAGSGIEMEVLTWSVWTFDEGGLLTRGEYFLDHDEEAARRALEAD